MLMAVLVSTSIVHPTNAAALRFLISSSGQQLSDSSIRAETDDTSIILRTSAASPGKLGMNTGVLLMRVMALMLVSAAALATTGNAASAGQHFTGSWNVEVLSESGTCNSTYRFPVVVQGGLVRYGGADGFGVATVTAKGTVRGSLQRGPVQANLVGRLTGRSGSGTWASSGNLTCSGRWRAQRST
jgi:hypothetical protein